MTFTQCRIKYVLILAQLISYCNACYADVLLPHRHTHTLYTTENIAVLVERSEPQSQQAKHTHEEQWYSDVNSECTCSTLPKCGDRFKALVQKIRAPGGMSTLKLRLQLNQNVLDLRNKRWLADCHHYMKGSAACDVVNMPRELLPRMGPRSTSTPDAYPYLSEHTINDVRAIRYIRARHAAKPYADMWTVVKARLQQFEATGTGTIAEAVVCNSCFWVDEKAYDNPFGNRSEAQKRRRSVA
jgi:hypothetical protein